jgi:ATP-dependent DNA helicase RecG
MFKEIERAEELGSGVRNLFRYAKAFAGLDPLLQEEQIFRVTVSIPSLMSIQGAATPQVTPQVTEQVTEQVERTQIILEFCHTPRSRGEIQGVVNIKDREYFRRDVLQPLLIEGLLIATIPDKPTSSKQRYITKGTP